MTNQALLRNSVLLGVLAGWGGCAGDGDKASPDKGQGDDDDTATVGDDDDDTTGPALVEVFVNEAVPLNRTGLTDESGAFPDWVELYNAGSADVDLEGYWLTDDVDDIFKWQFPAGVTIEAGGFLVIFCDEDVAQGPLHASFNLGGLDGEDVALFGRNVDANPLVDAFEDLTLARPDTSFARVPDGGPTIQEDGTPSPGSTNQ